MGTVAYWERVTKSATRSPEIPNLYTHLHDQLHPPFGERCEISNSLRASNLAWLPLTVHSNCSERLWLHARAFLVSLGNRLGWSGESISSEDIRFLFSPLTAPPLWPPKLEHNAVSAIADEIWQYRMGGNLVGGSQARLDARNEFEILQRSPKGGGEAGRANECTSFIPATLHPQAINLWLKRKSCTL